MAAYGALLSLTNTIHQILNHPRPPISLDKLQIEPLIQKVAFLMQFLENYIIDDAEYGLEGRMIDAANAAEDIIESHIADRITHTKDEDEDSLYRYIQKMMIESDVAHEAEDIVKSNTADYNISRNDDDSLDGELKKVMHGLDSITKDVAAIKEKTGRKIVPSCMEDDAMVDSDDVMKCIMDKLNSRYDERDNRMVGSDDAMYDIMDKLTNQHSGRWIIAIAGMGGIGKTTLAKKIYENPLIVEHFYKRGWATVSQEINSKGILLEILRCLKTYESEDNFGKMSEPELGQNLYQSLFDRRYLIVMDDIWDTDAWDRVKAFFPNNNNGSRVLITTRLSKVAFQLDGPDYFHMRFLNQNESWNLLRWCVFQEQACPPELEEIGKEIAGKCRGLPLSIVVIGGLLAKSEQAHENWQHIDENLSSIVNLEDDERCYTILKLSYNQLPAHLKTCFLYMGMFPEDKEIHVPTLLKLWVDEGFVKPVAGKSLETVARVVYLHDLVLRNLVLVRNLSHIRRRIQWCGIHDLLRDLCIKEAEKYKFFRMMEITHNPDHDKSWSAERRIGIHQVASDVEYIPRPLPVVVQSASRAQTMIWNINGSLPSVVPFRLLRILNGYNGRVFYYNTFQNPLGVFFHLLNLRHMSIITTQQPNPLEFYLWNLRMLRVETPTRNELVLDIWRMPQLRHVMVTSLLLTNPPPLPTDEENDWMVLENLEKLKRVWNLRLGEEVVERIPNIKKLEIVTLCQDYYRRLIMVWTISVGYTSWRPLDWAMLICGKVR